MRKLLLIATTLLVIGSSGTALAGQRRQEGPVPADACGGNVMLTSKECLSKSFVVRYGGCICPAGKKGDAAGPVRFACMSGGVPVGGKGRFRKEVVPPTIECRCY